LQLVKAVREITDTMLVVNAAVNFVIYVVFNRGFRDRLASHLCWRSVSVTSTRVLQRSESSCCWSLCERGGHRPSLSTINDFEMMTQSATTLRNANTCRKKPQEHRRRFLSIQTDL